jgi:LysM repeat protein
MKKMKDNKLQTKRKAQKGFRAMYARTVGKKVRASAAASADELDGDVPNVGIGKALTVILILHVLAIVAIYVGTQWRDDDGSSKISAIATESEENSEGETNTPSEASDDNPGTVYLDTPASYNLDNDAEGGDSANQDQGLSVEPRKRTPRVIKPRRDPNKDHPQNNTAETASTNYKIQKGDNFYRLAKRFKVKQQQLIDMNPNVDASKMRIGMEIKVPQH